MRARGCSFCFLWCLCIDYSTWGRFEKYPEDNASGSYGIPGPDPHGKDFPDFDYTSI